MTTFDTNITSNSQSTGKPQGNSSDEFLLAGIKCPKDLEKFTYPQLKQIATELRATILAVTSQNGGHVASSLGAVEIILAVHRVFNSSDDSVIFDVGHQAMAHKMLTGRFDQIFTYRQHDGLAGFTRRCESDYDTHDSGHASDSLSIAEGLATSKILDGDNGEVVVLIGDASISGGMATEALNHIGHMASNVTIILNDNEMSISSNVGAMSLYLGRIRTSQQYRHMRDKVKGRFYSLGEIGRTAMDVGESAKNAVKKFLVGGTMFEDMGITYIGPIDGHDIYALEQAMQSAKACPTPVLIHTVTAKGKGYAPAEANPSTFHGVPGFDIATGKVAKVSGSSGFTKTFAKLMLLEGEKNPNLVAITAAMEQGTGLSDFRHKFPTRFYDVGISEEHAAAMAAGLAIGGKVPVLAVYSTFMQRAFDQVVTNIALPNLHVVMCLDRAGLVGRDGSTHHGLLDMAYMRLIPNVSIMSPSTTEELAGAFRAAMDEIAGPVVVRYPRQADTIYEPTGEEQPWEIGKAVQRREGCDVAIMAIGRMVGVAMQAAEQLAAENIEASVYDMRWVKPIDKEAIAKACDTKLIVTLEDGTVVGGFGSAVSEVVSSAQLNQVTPSVPPVLTLGFPDTFVQHGSEDELFNDFGLSAPQIAQRIKAALLAQR